MIWLKTQRTKRGYLWFENFEQKFLTKYAQLIDEKFSVLNYIKAGGYNITLERIQQYLN
jgi:hypothetical protein